MALKEEFLALFSTCDDETKRCADFLYANRFNEGSITSLIKIVGSPIAEAQLDFIKTLKQAIDRFPDEQKSSAFHLMVDAIEKIPSIAPLILCINDYNELRFVIDYLTDFPGYIELIQDFIVLYKNNQGIIVAELCDLMNHVNTTGSLGFVIISRFASIEPVEGSMIDFINFINSSDYREVLNRLVVYKLGPTKSLSAYEHSMMVEIASVISGVRYNATEMDFITSSLSPEKTLELYSFLLEHRNYLTPVVKALRIIMSNPETAYKIGEIDIKFIKCLIISLHPCFSDKLKLIGDFFKSGVSLDELAKLINALVCIKSHRITLDADDPDYINLCYSDLMLGCIYFSYYSHLKTATCFLEGISERAGIYYTQAQLLLASIAFIKIDPGGAKVLLRDIEATETDTEEVSAMIHGWAARQGPSRFIIAEGLLGAALSAASVAKPTRGPDLSLLFKKRGDRGDSDATAGADAIEVTDELVMTPYSH